MVKLFKRPSNMVYAWMPFVLFISNACQPAHVISVTTQLSPSNIPTIESIPALTSSLEAESIPTSWKKIDIDLAKLHYQQLTGASFDDGYNNYLKSERYYSSDGLDEHKSYGQMYFTPMLVSYTKVSLAPITDNQNDVGLLLILVIDDVFDENNPIFFGGLVWYQIAEESKSIDFYDFASYQDVALSPKKYLTLEDMEQRLNGDIVNQTFQMSQKTDPYFKLGVLLRFADTNVNWNDFHDRGLMWDDSYEKGLLRFKDVMQYYLSNNTYLRTNSAQARVTSFDEATSFGRQPDDIQLLDDSISFITNGNGLDVGLILLEFITFP